MAHLKTVWEYLGAD